DELGEREGAEAEAPLLAGAGTADAGRPAVEHLAVLAALQRDGPAVLVDAERVLAEVHDLDLDPVLHQVARRHAREGQVEVAGKSLARAPAQERQARLLGVEVVAELGAPAGAGEGAHHAAGLDEIEAAEPERAARALRAAELAKRALPAARARRVRPPV